MDNRGKNLFPPPRHRGTEKTKAVVAGSGDFKADKQFTDFPSAEAHTTQIPVIEFPLCLCASVEGRDGLWTTEEKTFFTTETQRHRANENGKQEQ